MQYTEGWVKRDVQRLSLTASKHKHTLFMDVPNFPRKIRLLCPQIIKGSISLSLVSSAFPFLGSPKSLIAVLFFYGRKSYLDLIQITGRRLTSGLLSASSNAANVFVRSAFDGNRVGQPTDESSRGEV